MKNTMLCRLFKFNMIVNNILWNKYLAESPANAASKTSGVLSVPWAKVLDNSSTYFSSGIFSSSESIY